MKIKTAELTGPALDWAVAKALGWHIIRVPADADGKSSGEVLAPPTIKDGEWNFPPRGRIGPGYFLRQWSTDWSQGGPLIFGGLISLLHEPEDAPGAPGYWRAFFRHDTEEFLHRDALVAGLRALVDVKLGGEVDVPDELVGGAS